MLSIKNRVIIFNLVRDIPYRLSDSDHNTVCISKAKLLGEFLVKSGLKCRVVKCLFDWKKQNIGQEVIQSRIDLKESLSSEHTFLRVFIPETKKWVNVDPTWDKGLKKVLSLATWDGINETILAVSTEKIWLAKVSPFDLVCPNFDKNNHFVKTFNRWLKRSRQKI